MTADVFRASLRDESLTKFDVDCDEQFIDRCADRVSFQLTYTRAKSSRQFGSDGITGDSIDDAVGSGSTPGDWSSGSALVRWLATDEPLTEERVLSQFFTDAISEGVHEVLEWFRLDGATALNPHDAGVEDAIFDRCRAFAADLWALRAKQERQS